MVVVINVSTAVTSESDVDARATPKGCSWREWMYASIRRTGKKDELENVTVCMYVRSRVEFVRIDAVSKEFGM